MFCRCFERSETSKNKPCRPTQSSLWGQNSCPPKRPEGDVLQMFRAKRDIKKQTLQADPQAHYIAQTGHIAGIVTKFPRGLAKKKPIDKRWANRSEERRVGKE